MITVHNVACTPRNRVVLEGAQRMPSISGLVVPKRAVPILRWIAERDDPGRELLEKALTAGGQQLSRAAIAERAQKAIPSAPAGTGDEVVNAVLSLVTLHFTHSWKIEDIADRVASDKGLSLESQQVSALREWLTRVLRDPGLNALAKGYDLGLDYPAIFHTARVLTDIRPVFGTEPNRDLIGAVVSHTLKIDYFVRSGHDELYVRLSDEDLDELADAIARAKEKGEKLRAFLNSSGLARLDEFMQ